MLLCGVGPSQRTKPRYLQVPHPITRIRQYDRDRTWVWPSVCVRSRSTDTREVFRQCICAMAELIEDEILDA